MCLIPRQYNYDTKLVRFIMLTSLTTSSIGNAEAFRFVPDPGAFDHNSPMKNFTRNTISLMKKSIS